MTSRHRSTVEAEEARMEAFRQALEQCFFKYGVSGVVSYARMFVLRPCDCGAKHLDHCQGTTGTLVFSPVRQGELARQAAYAELELLRQKQETSEVVETVQSAQNDVQRKAAQAGEPWVDGEVALEWDDGDDEDAAAPVVRNPDFDN